MSKRSKAQTEVEEFLAEVAATIGANGFPDFDELLDTYEEVERSTEHLLKPGQLPSLIDISSLGLGRSNMTCADQAKEIAADLGLSPQYEACKVKYSKTTHSLLCTPFAKFIQTQPDLVQVTWAPDGSEMRIDLGAILAAENWRIPTNYEMRCRVAFVRKHPKVGSAMVIFLNEEGLRDSRSRIRKKNQAKSETANDRKDGEASKAGSKDPGTSHSANTETAPKKAETKETPPETK